MNEIEKIIKLLELWKIFTDNNVSDFKEFAVWILKNDLKKDIKNIPQNNKINEINLNTDNKKLNSLEDIKEKYSQNYQFLSAYLLFRLSKFIKIYTKELLSDSGLSSIDEFSFLALIDQLKEPSKKEICNYNLTEITTGMDIIKRLEKKGFATEIIDKNDKRAKRLKITPLGQEVINKTYQNLRELKVDILGNLNDEERNLIIKFLKQLDYFHTNLLKNIKVFDANK